MLCFIIVSCQPPGEVGAPSQNIGARLVTLLPLTGALSSKGPSREQAARLASSQINAAGGLKTGRIQLDHLDSGTQVDIAKQALETYLENSGVPAFLIGASSSQVSRGVLDIASRRQFSMISPASTASFFTQEDENDVFFRTAPSDAFQGTVLADRIGEGNVKQLSIVYLNDAYGQSLKDTLASSFKANGGQVVIEVPYDANANPALESKILEMLKTPTDGICLIGYPEEAPVVFNTWIKSGLQPDVRWFFSDGLKASETIQGVTDPLRLNESLGTIPSSVPQEASARFEQDFLEAYQEIPVSFAAHTYDAVVLAALALQQQAVNPSLSVSEALREVSSPPGKVIGPGVNGLKTALETLASGASVNYEGASGNVDFDARGDVLSDYEIWTFKTGFIFRVETRSLLR